MAKTSSTITQTTPTNSGTITSSKPISDMLAALVAASALTKTSDTGQISWGSITATQTASVYGYEVYRFADSLDATFPVFMKFTYGQLTAGSGNHVTTYIEIGTGSDGAGNLTNSSGKMPFKYVNSNITADATARSCFASSGDGYLNLFGGFNTAYGSIGMFFLMIERSRDTSGNSTSAGVTVTLPDFYVYSQTYYRVGGTASSTPSNYLAAGQGTHSVAYGNTVNLFSNSSYYAPPAMTRGGSFYATPQYDGTNYLATTIQPAVAAQNVGAALGFLIGDDMFSTVGTTINLTVSGTSHAYYNTAGFIPWFHPAIQYQVTTPIVMAVIPLIRYE